MSSLAQSPPPTSDSGIDDSLHKLSAAADSSNVGHFCVLYFWLRTHMASDYLKGENSKSVEKYQLCYSYVRKVKFCGPFMSFSETLAAFIKSISSISTFMHSPTLCQKTVPINSKARFRPKYREQLTYHDAFPCV